MMDTLADARAERINRRFARRLEAADIQPPFDLNDDQRYAYRLTLERLAAGERLTSLQGYAGTGKTYLVGRLIDALASASYPVYACAPTHKATNVLRGKIQRLDVAVQTIHAFLALKLTQDGRGGYVLRRDFKKDVPEHGIVFVDEASMVGAVLWRHIEASPAGLRWVFIGDPAQLPPVDEDPSPALSLPGAVLTGIVRQAEGNPIVTFATAVRGAEDAGRLPVRQVFRDGVGIGATNLQEDFVARAAHAFGQDAFRSDATFARVLCYRNRVASEYNTEIRRRLFGREAVRFEVGEWLVAMDSWSQYGKIVLVNSEEVRVEAAAVGSVKIDAKTRSLFEAGATWQTWDLAVKGPRDAFTRTIPLLHESEQERYERALSAAKDEGRRSNNWEGFYALKEAFAAAEYLYAMTVHKSQGSTFHTAFVDWQDLRNSGADRNALMYVATTRPSHRLALLV